MTEFVAESRHGELLHGSLAEKHGNSLYKLNHYAISWDPTTRTTTPRGLASIREASAWQRMGTPSREHL